jgi:phenylacetaldehyde dehydrogenase
MEPGTQMGPVVSDEQFRTVSGYLESGKADGATAAAAADGTVTAGAVVLPPPQPGRQRTPGQEQAAPEAVRSPATHKKA